MTRTFRTLNPVASLAAGFVARTHLIRQIVSISMAATVACSSVLLAQTTPSQTPLLVSSAGAKPNLMISLDNSGSMAFSFQETYGIYSDDDSSFELRRCPDDTWSDLSGVWVAGGIADFRNNQQCIFRSWDGNYYYSTTRSVPFVPAATTAGNWVAQRSAQVNPLYYDPRVTYAPRVGPDGNPLVPGDGVVFVSNQNSTKFDYRVRRNDANPAEIRTRHSIYASNPTTGTGWTQFYAIDYLNYRIPQHATFTTANVATATPFTYVTCNDVVSVAGLQVGCRSWSTPVNILPGSPATVPLPTGHKRTDCGATSCTNAQEITNILNWYRYYLFRAPAVATAIGQALANTDYDDRLRVGYTLINQRNNTTVGQNNNVPGATTDRPLLLRGVRMHRLGSADTAQIYTWLYDQDGTHNRHSNLGTAPAFDSTVNRREAPAGGTPLHNTIDRIAQYYKVDTGVSENAWRTFPTAAASASNQEMTCRRSFNLLFSDGAWNAGTSTINGSDFDNTDGPLFSRVLASGDTETFRYLRQGINTDLGRRQYTPYPSSAVSGLADLTARYYWHEDLRPLLNNEVQTRPGQPTFWQNMATYTVGYLIRPRGEVPGATSGLTFNQITNYQSQYAQLGYAAATKPTWATGDVNSASSDQARVDDFIQAGFTGGGQGFSVTTADDVRRAFQIILSDIVNSSGRDAGVAVSSAGADTSSIAGDFKYNVSYRTLDNSGDVTAQKLDALGNIVGTEWQASNTIPAAADRRVFAMSGQNSPRDFSGNFSSLATDIQDALKAGPNPERIPTDARFVNYLRGLDPVTDTQGRLLRQRSTKMGAMVNPPSIYMGGDTDFGYDMNADSDLVAGSSSYEAYLRQKVELPASLFVATNAGQVHSFNAATGSELAVFMPRRSMKHMLDYVRDDYAFKYVLDGPISEHDIYSTAADSWQHLAVGTGGRGERLVYGVRSPLNATAVPPNREPGRVDFLWEIGPEEVDNADLKMGHITNAARSGQTRSGDWVVLLNSGHYNGETDGSKHGLIVLNALTGNVIRRIPLPGGYSAGRGLSGVTAVRDESKRIVAAYAGDANGNLWRFNLKGAPSTWDVSYNRPLFTTPNNRPIYGAPAWQTTRRHDTGTVVVFATGMLMDENDPGDVSNPEAIYGIWDPTKIGDDDATGFATRTVGELLTQDVSTAAAISGVNGNEYLKTSAERYDPDVHKGWRLTLNRETGERSLDQIRNLGSNVLIATTVIQPPADPNAEMCRLSDLPTNYLYVLDAQTGAMPRKALDQDGDGNLDAYSVVKVGGGGYSRGMAVRVTFTGDRWSETLRKRRNTQADEGEGSTENKCVTVTARLLGTEGGSIAAGSICGTGWNRSQYQLVRPPQ